MMMMQSCSVTCEVFFFFCCCGTFLYSNCSICFYSYSLSQTKLFLHSLLDEEPVKTVVAPEAPRYRHQRAASKEREMVFTNTSRKRGTNSLVNMNFTYITWVYSLVYNQKINQHYQHNVKNQQCCCHANTSTNCRDIY